MFLKLPVKTRLKPLAFRSAMLIILWCTGLLLGLHIATVVYLPYIGFYYAAAGARAAFAGLFAVFFLPFLLSVIAIRKGIGWIVFPLAICKAFVLGFNLAMLQFAFSQSAWLVRIFVMFSDLTSGFLLLWLWLVILSKHEAPKRMHYVAYSVLAALLILLDYFFISPFLAEIL